MSPKQIDIESARGKLRAFYHRNKRLPSFREMAELFKYKSTNAVHRLVQKLKNIGALEQDATGRLIPAKLHAPVKVLGIVAAGWPTPAEEELLDTLSLDDYLIQRPAATFLIEVTGDSMIGAGIMAGDLVLVERGHEPKHGDIVIAEVDSEWTMKHFERVAGKVMLRAANPKYSPIYPKQELNIAGIVMAVIRKYKTS